MSNFEKISIGIRDSNLSIAQTKSFLKELKIHNNINGKYNFELKTIKTLGDKNKTQRLDLLGGKGLFIKEIENSILNDEIDVGIHSMKDVPATGMCDDLEIICWSKRAPQNDVLISNSGKSFFDLPKGSIIGTSSIRRRAQVLSLRKDLKIKLLRGNVDTRIKFLKERKYDAIILSLAGIQRLGVEKSATEVLDKNLFLPPACQGVIGVQAKKESPLKNLFSKINCKQSQITSHAERRVLKKINANCNSPISVLAEILDGYIRIDVELFAHTGERIYKNFVKGSVGEYIELSDRLGEDIVNNLGQNIIDELEILKDDFDYSPKN